VTGMAEMSETPLTFLIGKLESEGLSPRRGSNTQWSSICPGHDDKRPSLSLAEGEDSRVLMKCHAGCRTEDILKALSLTMRDLFPEGSAAILLPPKRSARRRASREPARPHATTFAFVPACVVENGCVYCLTIYSHLALRCGKQNLPQRGYRFLSNALGIDARTVCKHAEYLAGMGWIRLRAIISATGAHRAVELSLRHCPPLKLVNPGQCPPEWCVLR
jgi:hypothetical protein